MKVIKTKGAVYRLSINQGSFEVMLAAIHKLSVKTQRFETLASVITAGAKSLSENLSSIVADLDALKHLDGEIKVFVRLTSERHKEFEEVRALLSKAGGRHFGVRDAIMVCTLLISTRK